MNLIIQYWHCKQCTRECPDGTSMQDWARFAVGTTPKGIQVWCVRHKCNVVALDFKSHLIGLDKQGSEPAVTGGSTNGSNAVSRYLQ